MTHMSAIFESWRAESRRRRETRQKREETAFLPAALEIMETPPSPIGRWILWTIIFAAFGGLTWAFLAKVDIVAVAEGRVIPRARLQSVESIETGIVRNILVTEGERVAAGDPLLELDPTYADADADSARSELATARLQEARALALLSYAETGRWSLEANEKLTEQGLEAERGLVTARIREYEAQLASLIERGGAAQSALSQAVTEIRRIDATLPNLRRQLEDYRALADDGYLPQVQVDELDERVTTLRYQRMSQMDEIEKSEREIAMLGRDRSALQEGFRAQASAELSEARAIISTRGTLVERAEHREQLQILYAPRDAIVNEIAVTTIGEVVEAGQPLMTLVPADDELIVEAFILNRDVGWIEESQPVIIKLEAFPFMRYGFLQGEVEHVSPDAVVDEARGLVYPARIRITGSTLRAERMGLGGSGGGSGRNGQGVNSADNAGETQGLDRDQDNMTARAEDLSTALAVTQAGMSVTAEVRTGERSVISYLLSPIARAVNESGRER